MEDDAKATSCSIKTSSVAPPSFKRQCFICLLYRATDYKKKKRHQCLFVAELQSEEVKEETSEDKAE